MGLKMQRQAPVPEGVHKGVISAARLTKKDFGKGPEETFEIVLTPDYKSPDGAQTLPLSCLFSPVLNGISALSLFLERLDREVPDGTDWNPNSLVGTRVVFTAQKNGNFIRVLKDTIRKE